MEITRPARMQGDSSPVALVFFSWGGGLLSQFRALVFEISYFRSFGGFSMMSLKVVGELMGREKDLVGMLLMDE